MNSLSIFDNTITTLENSLNIRARKHELIISNVANHDTPNYKAFDMVIEEEFNKIYQKTLEKSPNIHFIGFIPIKGKQFNALTSQCGFVVFPSCSEGTATSVTTCMRRGLIPVVTYESGIDIGDFGFMIKNTNIEAVKKQIESISLVSNQEFKRRMVDTYIESFKYTQQSFSESFENALLNVMLENNLI